MKRLIKPLLGVFLIGFISPVDLFAQINTFPYVQDFENFTSHSTTGSCNATLGISKEGWTQVTGDDGDWRADAGGTPSLYTGPGSNALISGDGLGKDANPGTLTGTYMYIESSGCWDLEYIFQSPKFNLSNPDSFYMIEFSYYMYGATMGSLHVDVYDGSSWTKDVWERSGSADSGWHVAKVYIPTFKDSAVQFRFRAKTGSSWQSDICIDNVIVKTYDPPTYDLELKTAKLITIMYPIFPLSQVDSMQMDLKLRNNGKNEATNSKITVTEGSYSATIDFDTISPFDDKDSLTATKYIPTSTGDKEVLFVCSMNETDVEPSNDSAYLTFEVSDSVLARETGTIVGNVGYTGGVGHLGQMFEIIGEDTLTSVSMYITPNKGDSIRVQLYSFDSFPKQLIDNSKVVVLDSFEGWYSLQLKCDHILKPGKYFIALEQLSNNNIGLGLTPGEEDSVAFYKTATGTWLPIKDANILGLFALRMNFGEVRYPEISIVSADTVCAYNEFKVKGQGGFRYQWSPDESFVGPKYSETNAMLSSSGNITLKGTSSCGFSSETFKFIYVKPAPHALVTADTTVCVGDQISLNINTSNPFKWNNGSTSSTQNVTILSDTTFTVTVDSSGGCSRVYTIDISSSSVEVVAYGDTAVCGMEAVHLSASGAENYKWSDNSMGAEVTIYPSETNYMVVTGSNSFGCTDTDSVLVEVLSTPYLVTTPDTTVCFGENFTLKATGGEVIQWIGGPKDSIYKIKMFTTKNYIVEAINSSGCKDVDTVTLTMSLPPIAEVSNDTTVCEGTAVTLKASGGSVYDWNNGMSGSEITFVPTEERYFSVKVSNNEGCSDKDSVFVSIDLLPQPDFSFKTYTDSIVFTNKSLGGDHYIWSFGDGDSSKDFSPYHVYDSSGTYIITLTAENHCGAVDTSKSVTVVIKTGSIDELAGMKVTAYPQPANLFITLQLDGAQVGHGQVKIIDQHGKVLVIQDFFKADDIMQLTLDLEGVSSGSYLLSVKMDDGIYWKTVLVL